MALWLCLDCTTTFAVGLELCPHCGSERSQEMGSDPYRGGTEPMAKITRYGGVSDAGQPDEEGQVDDTNAEAGEQSSPGSSSETSSPKPETSSQPSEPVPPKRARTTGSRSGKGRTGASSARTTDGDPTDGTSATASSDDDGASGDDS